MCSDCRRPRTPRRYRRCQRVDSARSDAPAERREDVPSDLAALYVSRHAIERLAQHHDGSDAALAVSLLATAVEVAPALAAALVGRRLEAAQDHYLVTADGRGMFVIARARAEAGAAWAVVTYLRLAIQSARFAKEITRRAA
jgi:hypothetical protein